MKLKVSFCNKTVLRNDITRYAPVWGGYTLLLAVAVLAFLQSPGEDLDSYYTEVVRFFSARAGHMALINGFYALAVVQALWGDLLNPRMCNSLHSLPVTRDSYYGAHLTAALLFALVPNVLIYGIAALVVEPLVVSAPLLALGAGCLQYVFYLGSALVAVQLAGNRVGMVLCYGLINFITILLYWFCSQIFAPLTYGVELDVSWVAKLCPTVAMYKGSYFMPRNYWKNQDYPWVYQGIEMGDLFPHAFAYGGLGLVFLIAAQLLYRKRKLEVAGDTLAYAPLKPVFLTLYTMMVAAFIHLGVQTFAQGSISQYWFLPLGLLVGYVTGLMLLQRTSRVFRKRMLLPALGILAVCALAVGSIYIDLFGVIRHVPDREDIVSVTVFPLSGYRAYVPEGAEQEEGLRLTAPEDIDIVLSYQVDALSHWQRQVVNSLRQVSDCWNPGRYYNVRLVYTLQNGRTLARRYPLRMDNPSMDRFRKILSRPELAFGMTEEDLRRCVNEADSVTYYLYGSSDIGTKSQELWYSDHPGLADAVLADCKDGNILSYSFMNEADYEAYRSLGSLDISGFDGGDRNKHFYLWTNITSQTTHIQHWLDTHEGSTDVPRG